MPAAAENREENANAGEVETCMVSLFDRLDEIEKGPSRMNKVSMKIEIRSLEFWKSVITECLASFIYVFLTSGAQAAATSRNPFPTAMLILPAISSGLAMVFLTTCFGKVSGAHVNPAVSIAMGIIQRISLIRTFMYLLAQCGGGIAGAAVLYGVSLPEFKNTNENFSLTYTYPIESFSPWQRFAVESMCSSLVIFGYFIGMETYRRWTIGAIVIGSIYAACSLVYLPNLNPAKALGPAFVWNQWDKHWIFWVAPVFGAVLTGLVYKHLFMLKIHQRPAHGPQEEEMSSIETEDYDDVDKPVATQFRGSTGCRSNSRAETHSNYLPNILANAEASERMNRPDPIYDGSKSLCRSPQLTRANLNRSQSVYSKSNNAAAREPFIKTGPLVPAQSLHSVRSNQHNHHQNQNRINQMQHNAEISYIRGATPGPTTSRVDNYERSLPRETYASFLDRQIPDNFTAVDNLYGHHNINNIGASSSDSSSDANPPPPRSRRPESFYGLLSNAHTGRNTLQKQSSLQYPEVHAEPRNARLQHQSNSVGGYAYRPPTPQF